MKGLHRKPDKAFAHLKYCQQGSAHKQAQIPANFAQKLLYCFFRLDRFHGIMIGGDSQPNLSKVGNMNGLNAFMNGIFHAVIVKANVINENLERNEELLFLAIGFRASQRRRGYERLITTQIIVNLAMTHWVVGEKDVP